MTLFRSYRADLMMSLGMAVMMITSGAAAQITLEPAVQYAAGVKPSGIATGDFSGNGHIDIATTVDNPDRVQILLNDGSGQFTLGPSIILPSSASPQDIIGGDFNNDGHADLAVAVRDPFGAVMIYLNNGMGQFTLTATVAVEDRPRGLSVGDVNADGWLDIAVANRDSHSGSVIFNNAGDFTAVHVDAIGETRDSALGDVSGDGMLDLALSDRDNRVVRLFHFNDGAFTAGPVLSVGGQVRPDGVWAADFTGSGLIDIVTATSTSNPPINQVSVFVNTGKGFNGPFNYSTGGLDASHIFAADFDCDGHLDVVVTNSDSDNASVLRNTGTGAFEAPIIVNVGTRPGRLEAADFTANGAPDIAIANRDSHDVSVILNTSEACKDDPCPIVGDLNCDGSVGVADLLILINAWGPCADCDNCPADLNGDCAVGIPDLLILINNWG